MYPAHNSSPELTTDAQSNGTPPRTVVVAFWALIVAAVGSAASGLAFFGSRSYVEHNLRDSATKALTQAKTDSDRTTAQKALADVHHNAGAIMTSQLVFGFLIAVVLVLLALRLKKRRYSTRWWIVGVWVVASYLQMSVGAVSLLAVGTSAPPALKVASFVGALAFLTAVVLVNVPATTRYLVRTRPVAASAGGTPQLNWRTIFAPRPQPRPSAGAKPPRGAPPAGTAASTADVAANTPVPRGKAKLRANSAEAPPAAPKNGAGRNRSKAKGR